MWRRAIRSSDSPVPVPKGATLTRPACPDLSADDYFFPAGVFGAISRLDQATRNWYSPYLHAMGEPSLSCGGGQDQEAYRFFYLRSFHDPMAVRLTRTDGGCRVVMTELNKDRPNVHLGHDVGSFRQRTERAVSRLECDQALTDVTEDVWNLTPTGPEPGEDGARWVVEARRANGYHVVDRWSPRGDFRSIGLRFLAVAKVSIPAAELY